MSPAATMVTVAPTAAFGGPAWPKNVGRGTAGLAVGWAVADAVGEAVGSAPEARTDGAAVDGAVEAGVVVALEHDQRTTRSTPIIAILTLARRIETIGNEFTGPPRTGGVRIQTGQA